MATAVVTALDGRFLIADGPLALDQNDTAQALPLRQVLKPAKLLRGPDASHFESAVFTAIDRLVKGVFDFSKVCSSRIGERACTHAMKPALKATGSMAFSTRLNVSAHGMPLGRRRNVLSQSCLAIPNSSISSHPSPTQIIVNRAMIGMSMNK